MKVRIYAEADELRTRSDDLKKVIERVIGDELDKANHADHGPRKLDHPVLQQSVDRASEEVERIKRIMLRKMNEVLKGAL